MTSDLVRLRAYRAPPAVRAAATAGWPRRWWIMRSVVVQHAVASTALGGAWLQPLQPEAGEGLPLDSIVHHAAAEALALAALAKDRGRRARREKLHPRNSSFPRVLR